MSTATGYEYDLNGNVTQKVLPNGTVETRTYDGRNRVTQVKTTKGVSVQSEFDYTYDGVGNVTVVNESYDGGLSARTIVNTYDRANRLTVEAITTGAGTVTTTYTYDRGHNRTSKVVSGGSSPGTTSYVIGDGSNGAGANQIVSATLPDSTVVSYTYDGNGNRSTRTIGANTDTYGYDNENRLVSLVKTTPGGAGSYTYGYDYRTRRVTRGEPGATTQVVFSGGTSIIETGASSVEYVRGPDQGGGVGGLQYSVRSGTELTNQYNSRGDVIGQSDSTETLTYQTEYEGFGSQASIYGSTPDRQKANTKEEDPTGLLNEGFRYRDLETGTFITRDPLGYAAGPNDYIYAGQNPWSKFDPLGLEEEQEENPIAQILKGVAETAAGALVMSEAGADILAAGAIIGLAAEPVGWLFLLGVAGTAIVGSFGAVSTFTGTRDISRGLSRAFGAESSPPPDVPGDPYEAVAQAVKLAGGPDLVPQTKTGTALRDIVKALPEIIGGKPNAKNIIEVLNALITIREQIPSTSKAPSASVTNNISKGTIGRPKNLHQYYGIPSNIPIGTVGVGYQDKNGNPAWYDDTEIQINGQIVYLEKGNVWKSRETVQRQISAILGH